MLAYQKDRAVSRHVPLFLSLAPCLLAAQGVQADEILPRQYVAAEFLERVEVFRGANSFLNGAAPGGSGVGGSFNLVPKRAPDRALNRVTVGAESGVEGYGALDFARRFHDGDFGVRANAVRRDGETSVDDQERQLTMFSLGMDYRSDKARLSADLGYQDQNIDAPRPSVTPFGEFRASPMPHRTSHSNGPSAARRTSLVWRAVDMTLLKASVAGWRPVSETVKSTTTWRIQPPRRTELQPPIASRTIAKTW